MKNFKLRLEGAILVSLMLIGTFAIAATVTSLKAGAVKDILPRANGGTGTVMSSTAAAASASAVNTAGGLAALDSSAKLPEAQLPTSVIPVSGTPAAGNLFGYDGSNAIPISLGTNLSIESGVLNAAGGTGAVVSGTPATDSMSKFVNSTTIGAASRGVDYAAPATVSTNIAGYIMPTGSISDAAATVTLGTALPATYSNGVWQYVEAGKPRADLPAAWRWTLMSTTTLGQICQETYDPTTQKPYIPASCTAFTDATPGTITGVITTYIPWIQFSVPANSLGKNGKIVSESWMRTNNSAGSKQVRVTFGASNVVDRSVTTSSGEMLYALIQNNGVAARQRSYYRSNMGVPNSANVTTEDTTAAKTYILSLRLNVATDIVGIDGFEVAYSGAPE